MIVWTIEHTFDNGTRKTYKEKSKNGAKTGTF